MIAQASPHIWVPNKTILEVTKTAAPKGGTVGGFFKITGHKADGRSRVIMDWQPNLITDPGLNRWGTGAIITYCHVGSGTVAPTVDDAQMGTWVASNSSTASSAAGAQATEPYYGWYRRTYRFTAPGTDKTLGEVGIGWSTGTPGSNLWSRSLIKNAVGTPVTITWLAGETLDVSYELRRYPWLVDDDYEDVISGVTYSGVQRCAYVTASAYWTPYGDSAITFHNAGAGSNYPLLYTGAIGAITGIPSGSTLGATSSSLNSYSSGSYRMTATMTYGPTLGITAKSWSCLIGVGGFQKSISPDLAKPVDYTLVINAETPTWGRA